MQGRFVNEINHLAVFVVIRNILQLSGLFTVLWEYHSTGLWGYMVVVDNYGNMVDRIWEGVQSPYPSVPCDTYTLPTRPPMHTCQ